MAYSSVTVEFEIINSHGQTWAITSCNSPYYITPWNWVLLYTFFKITDIYFFEWNDSFGKPPTCPVNYCVYCHLVVWNVHYNSTSASVWTRKQNLRSQSVDCFLWVTLYHSLEEMADMDELFGSDGDSDNDQRGIYASEPLNINGL